MTRNPKIRSLDKFIKSSYNCAIEFLFKRRKKRLSQRRIIRREKSLRFLLFTLSGSALKRVRSRSSILSSSSPHLSRVLGILTVTIPFPFPSYFPLLIIPLIFPLPPFSLSFVYRRVNRPRNTKYTHSDSVEGVCITRPVIHNAILSHQCTKYCDSTPPP